MKRYNNRERTGHLLIFNDYKDPEDNFSFFFPVEGLDDLDHLFVASEGFQRCLEQLKIFSRYELQSHTVNDIGCVRDNLPQIDEKRLCRLELNQFVDGKNFVAEFAQTVIKWFASKRGQELPSLRTGAIATGSSFFDREEEKELIWKKAGAGKSILLQSPRRYGKSSLLKHLQQNPLSGWKSCYIDLQGGKSVVDFLEILVSYLMLSEEYSTFLPFELAKEEPWKLMSYKRIELKRKERGEIKEGWKEYGNELFSRLNGNNMLLIFDEFSYMLEDMLESVDGTQNVEDFMAWFANERKKTRNVSFVLSGSEYLKRFLKRHGINGHVDDLEPVTLGLFNYDTALSLMLLLFIREGISVEKKELDCIIHLLGKPIPYFLQVFVDLICAECRNNGELSLREIEELYDKHLLGADGRRHFDSIKQQMDRYGMNLQKGRDAAKMILNRLAEAGNKAVEEKELKVIWAESGGAPEKFDDVMDCMKDDFYLDMDANRNVAMAGKLVRDWWAKYIQE